MDYIEIKYQEKCAAPSDIHEHLPTLRRYSALCKHVTELGVRGITSTWGLLAGKPEYLIAVDQVHPINWGGDLAEFAKVAETAGVKFVFVEADDRTIELEPTDLLFIDTWHVYEQLKIELELHASKVRKFIILHDTETYSVQGETSGHPGLGSALNEFLTTEEGRRWQIREHYKNCNGLTILERID